MPSSNTPSDLKTVIIRALDAACTNASDENSNGCLSRSFANIKELPRLLFQCATLATPRCDPVDKRQHHCKCRVFYFRNLSSLSSKGEALNLLGQATIARDISATSHIGLIARTQLNFISVSSSCYQTRNIWRKLTDRGSSTTKSTNFLSIEGG